MSLRIETYRGERAALRPLFELAEDSARALESYLGAGRVIVAAGYPDVVVEGIPLRDRIWLDRTIEP